MTDCGRGAESDRYRKRSSCVRDTNTNIGNSDELDGERREEKAGTGRGLMHS